MEPHERDGRADHRGQRRDRVGEAEQVRPAPTLRDAEGHERRHEAPEPAPDERDVSNLEIEGGALAAYASLRARAHPAGGGFEILDREGYRALAVVDRGRAIHARELHFLAPTGATVLVLSPAQPSSLMSGAGERVELRSGHGRVLGSLERAKDGALTIARPGGRPHRS